MVTSLAEGVLLAPPPETLALLVKEAPAFEATLTVKLIGLPVLVAEIGLLLVQVTVWPEAPHVQPVPLAEL